MIFADLLTQHLPSLCNSLPVLVTPSSIGEADSQLVLALGFPPPNDRVFLLLVVVADVQPTIQQPFLISLRIQSLSLCYVFLGEDCKELLHSLFFSIVFLTEREVPHSIILPIG